MNKTSLLAIPLVASAVAMGGALAGYAGLASAQTASTSATETQQSGTPPHTRGTFDPKKGGHIGQNGTREELLTGDQASKATAAALGAVPGGTVDRVETDADGAAFEAHMTKSDGSHVTVKFDQNFAVTGTETGPPMHQ